MKYFLSSLFIFFLALTVFFSSCKKDPLYIDHHKDTTITGNNPPPYHGISDLQVKLYINKLHVDLLGREATVTELDSDFVFLKANNLSITAREVIANSLLNLNEFYKRLFDLTSSDMTNSVDSTTIAQEIIQYQYFYYFDSLNGNYQNFPYYIYEINRMSNLLNAEDNLESNTIDLREFYRRFMDNYFYDEVNMGTENFVKGSFDDLYMRNPTDYELQQSENMVDGGASLLFDQSGNSKGDYENIMVGSAEFTEGFIRKCFQQFMLRQPTSSEMGLANQQISVALDWKTFLKQLVSTDEYAGF